MQDLYILSKLELVILDAFIIILIAILVLAESLLLQLELLRDFSGLKTSESLYISVES